MVTYNYRGKYLGEYPRRPTGHKSNSVMSVIYVNESPGPIMADFFRTLLDNVDPIVRDILIKLKKTVLTATISIEDALYIAIRDTVDQWGEHQWGEELDNFMLSSGPIIITAFLKSGLSYGFDKPESLAALKEIVIEILERCLKALGINFVTTATKKVAKEAAKEVVEEVSKKATKEAAKKAAKEVVEEAAKETAKKATKETAKKATKEAVKKTTKETVKETTKYAFVSAAIFDVTLLGFSVAYNLYEYERGYITREKFQEHMATKTVATGGSIAGTTIGAGIGTLILPGVGTFVGSFIGGIAGDVVGSNTGKVVYDTIFSP